MPALTLVHVCRHGLVHNPDDLLYSRLPGFHLSFQGQLMAEALAARFAAEPLTYLGTSPLERARETMAPIASRHPDLAVHVDWRLIEADSAMQGQTKGRFSLRLARPSNWHLFIHPGKAAWGEAYAAMATRTLNAIADAGALAGAGGAALLVSHQAPIWVARRAAENKFLFNIPATRQCGLASVTTFTVDEQGTVRFAAYQPATP